MVQRRMLIELYFCPVKIGEVLNIASLIEPGKFKENHCQMNLDVKCKSHFSLLILWVLVSESFE